MVCKVYDGKGMTGNSLDYIDNHLLDGVDNLDGLSNKILC